MLQQNICMAADRGRETGDERFFFFAVDSSAKPTTSARSTAAACVSSLKDGGSPHAISNLHRGALSEQFLHVLLK